MPYRLFLSRNGHDAIVLNRPFCSKPSVAKVLAKACCRLLKKMLGRETVPLFYDFKHYKEYTVISQHTEAFIEKEYSLSLLQTLYRYTGSGLGCSRGG